MSDGNFLSVGFDEASLGAIAHMAQFSVFLDNEIAPTLKKIGDDIAYDAIVNTWAVFAHPNGDLASTIEAIPTDAMSISIGSDSPYARRREFGGGGLLDSLGRAMNDVAKPYLEPALTANEDKIMQSMGLAIAEGFAQMGAL